MKRVLIVDDKADNRYLLQMLLKGHGFEVEVALHGIEALAKAGEHPPDLVISDLLMPEMDGYSLLRRWRSDERLRAIPFIVYTATYTDPKDEELAFQLGADAFIVKPTEPEPFMQQVREVLDRVEDKLHPADAPPVEERAILKLYNEALIRKLEHKCAQLELRVGELIRTEAELRRVTTDLEGLVEARTADLVEANKELEAFSFSVSHDLRAPLGAISGFTTTIIERNEGKLDASSLSLLKRVHAGAARMELLIDDLIDLARVSRKELQSRDFDLSESALNVASALRQSDAARNVRIEVAPGMSVRADPGLMGIVLENLIGNAWKFTSKTGDPVIKIGSDHGADGSTVYYVRDNGAGFDMDYAYKLFSPFQRLHTASEFPGSGIGLSIVQRIITRHRGRIWGESILGHGATFRFTLPAQRPEKTHSPRPNVGPGKTSG